MSPFRSNQDFRSPARFFDNNISSTLCVSLLSSATNRTRRLVSGYRCFPELQRIHLTQTLKPLDLYLASKLLFFEPSKDMLAFSLIERVMNIFARVNAIKRGIATKTCPSRTRAGKCLTNKAMSDWRYEGRLSLRRQECIPSRTANPTNLQIRDPYRVQPIYRGLLGMPVSRLNPLPKC